MKRTSVEKTYKLYVGGKSIRSESGRSFPLHDPKTGALLANVARASRKDLRDAVTAARSAFPGWAGKTAYNRGQILYRMAEMLEARRAEFEGLIVTTTGTARGEARKEVTVAIDRLVWYAGWADKFCQLFGTVNPVALPYFNFTLPEPTGVVGSLLPEDPSLLPLVSKMAPIIVGGNTAVCIVPEKNSVAALVFAEVLHSSDPPGGVVNILTGGVTELIPHLAKHMDVNAIDYTGTDPKILTTLQEDGAGNLKRVVSKHSPTRSEWFSDKTESPWWIESFVEMKTTWHPVGV